VSIFVSLFGIIYNGIHYSQTGQQSQDEPVHFTKS